MHSQWTVGHLEVPIQPSSRVCAQPSLKWHKHALGQSRVFYKKKEKYTYNILLTTRGILSEAEPVYRFEALDLECPCAHMAAVSSSACQYRRTTTPTACAPSAPLTRTRFQLTKISSEKSFSKNCAPRCPWQELNRPIVGKHETLCHKVTSSPDEGPLL